MRWSLWILVVAGGDVRQSAIWGKQHVDVKKTLDGWTYDICRATSVEQDHRCMTEMGQVFGLRGLTDMFLCGGTERCMISAVWSVQPCSNCDEPACVFVREDSASDKEQYSRTRTVLLGKYSESLPWKKILTCICDHMNLYWWLILVTSLQRYNRKLEMRHSVLGW